jgi:CBS domain-containing protein
MRRLQRTIAEIGWAQQVPQVARDVRVSRALEAMQRDAYDSVLVVEGTKLVGIFTTRDFLNRVAARRLDPQDIAIGDVMTASPRTLAPDDPVAFAINWMAIEGFRNVPIVDRHSAPPSGGAARSGEAGPCEHQGQLLGVLTIWDVMRQLGELFAELEATPRAVRMQDEISAVVAMTDVGGDG